MSEVSLESTIDSMLEREREFESKEYPEETFNAETEDENESFSSEADDAPAQPRRSEDTGRESEARSERQERVDPKAPNQQAQERQAQQKPEGWLEPDAKGNLVDANGKIVAKAGSERRLYETSVRARHERDNAVREQERLYNESQQLQSRVKELEKAATVYKQFGLDDNEFAEGLGFLQMYKQNPMQIAGAMLTDLAQKGYDLGTLLSRYIQVGEDGQVRVAPSQNGQLNPQTVQHMVQQAVNPLLEQQRRQQEQELNRTRIQREAVETANRFLSNPAFPYARVHEQTIAQMLSKNPSLSPEGAYAQLQQWAMQNGLDFSQDLGAQVNQRQQPRQPPNLNLGNGGAEARPLETPNVNPASDSPQDIVRAAMADAGFNFDR